MRTHHWLAGLAALGLVVTSPVPAMATTGQDYYCLAGDITYLFSTPANGQLALEVSIGEMIDPALAGTFMLEQASTQDEGVVYTNGDFTVVERDGNYAVQEGDYDAFPCEIDGDDPIAETASPQIEVAPLTSIQAQSWGGNVRSGPGTEHPVTASLAEGAPITLVENTGVSFNSYDWFEITHQGGTGYHWGGIICGVAAPIEGAFQTCN